MGGKNLNIGELIMKTKSTPGPWSVSEHASGEISISNNFNAKIIADMTNCENHKANARLIASSPTMYQYIIRKSLEGDLDAKKIIDEIEGK